MSIGKRIQQFRKDRKLTQQQFGALIGKSEITIRKYEANDVEVSLTTINKIARALDVQVFEIIGFGNKVSDMKMFYIEESEKTLIGQLRKVDKENDEFNKAIIKNDRANLLEEFWDKRQADLGVLKLYGITKEELQESFEDHKRKLKKRGHKFIEIR